MGLEICTVGGYEEVGKNMTAVKIGEDVILFDAGIYLPAIIEFQEKDAVESKTPSEEKLRKIDALPNDKILDKLGWRDKVRAIIIGHSHLDHIGAVPYLAHRYPNAKILGTPFTMEFLEQMLQDEKISLRNPRIKVNEDSSYVIKGKSGNYKADFIHTTHSTLQCVFVMLHTPQGNFFYALDFKFDNHPIIGAPPNYKKLREVGAEGVDVLVVDSLYSGIERKTPSERIARNLIEDAFDSVRSEDAALIVSTFSSHIARLKSIVDFGKKTGRKIVFLGRSLNKYVGCAIKVKQCPFQKDIIMMKYKNQINSFLKKVEKSRNEYLIVCTGHQAEEGSVLDRIVEEETPLKLRKDDHVIFSSSVIPAPTNINARDKMDKKLRRKGVRIQSDVHVSGHGSGDDLKDLVEMLKPKHIIPAHGSLQKATSMVELTSELGYKFGETCHLSLNGKVLKL